MLSKRTDDRSHQSIRLDSNEVHELRDHIQALRVGFSLLSKGHALDDETLSEVHQEIADSLDKLAKSSLFKRTAAPNRVR